MAWADRNSPIAANVCCMIFMQYSSFSLMEMIFEIKECAFLRLIKVFCFVSIIVFIAIPLPMV